MTRMLLQDSDGVIIHGHNWWSCLLHSSLALSNHVLCFGCHRHVLWPCQRNHILSSQNRHGDWWHVVVTLVTFQFVVVLFLDKALTWPSLWTWGRHHHWEFSLMDSVLILPHMLWLRVYIYQVWQPAHLQSERTVCPWEPHTTKTSEAPNHLCRVLFQASWQFYSVASWCHITHIWTCLLWPRWQCSRHSVPLPLLPVSATYKFVRRELWHYECCSQDLRTLLRNYL